MTKDSESRRMLRGMWPLNHMSWSSLKPENFTGRGNENKVGDGRGTINHVLNFNIGMLPLGKDVCDITFVIR